MRKYSCNNNGVVTFHKFSVMIEVIAAKERSMTERFLRGKYETNESIEVDQWYRDVYVSEWTYLYWLLFTG